MKESLFGPYRETRNYLNDVQEASDERTYFETKSQRLKMMVEPVGYNSLWEKFENDVLNTVKKYFSDYRSDFQVRWNYEIRGVNPDVAIIGECHCGAKPENEPCEIPLLIFEASHMFKLSGKEWEEKNKQMEKYARICPSVLVTPNGYAGRAFCKSPGDKYRILSLQYFHMYLRCLRKNLKVERVGEMCGDVLSCDVGKSNKIFELQMRSRVDRCPACNSKAHPEALVYCAKYNEHYYPDFLDTEDIDHTSMYTHAECGGCDDWKMFGSDFEDCPATEIKYVYQCDECGAIFDPDTEEIVYNFEEAHADMMQDFPFYENEAAKKK